VRFINPSASAQSTGGVALSNSTGDSLLFEFSKPEDGAAWSAVNDNVMGGVSEGSLRLTDHRTALFSGQTSLEHHGGFSSVHSKTGTYDLSGFQGITIRCLGDGRRYKLFLRTDTSFDGVMYQADFEAPKGEWVERFLAFRDFIPTHHGTVIQSAGPLAPSRIRFFGLLIADGQAGPFRLEIDWARASG
jgi:monofunctional biosynthetic peptidoglycan transglycosylase